MRTCLVIFLSLIATPAAAQLGGLPLRVPSLPNLPVVGKVDNVLDRTEGTVRDLTTQRLGQVDDLLSRYPRVLERGPQDTLIVRSQVVAYAPSAAALDAARAAGFTIGETETLDGLDVRMVVLMAPDGLSTRAALKRLRKLDPEGTYDFNDIYLGSASAPAAGETGAAHGEGGGRVGLIDGGIDPAHQAFKGAHVTQQGFNGQAVPSPHGMATASLLVGRADGFAGAAPGADLLVADVYCGAPTGGSTSSILKALDWMAREKVGVVNISLVGPDNAPLRLAVGGMVKRGHLLVAAVGNDGPAAKPLYPASYDGVVGVTGVDRRNHVLPEAGRGPQVDFAAPGADIAAATPSGGYAAVRGTSFAAPIVAGLLAKRLSRPDPAQAQAAVAALSAQAADLGAKGIDTTYGQGLVGGDVRPDLQSLQKKK